MNDLGLFTEETLRAWVEIIRQNPTKIHLPEIDEEWYAEVMSCQHVMAILPDCKRDFHVAAANLFYKVAKNHYRVDGNKRSAVVSTYLFCIVNDQDLRAAPKDLYEFAKKVARSRKKHDKCLPMIVEFFRQHCIPSARKWIPMIAS